jgi:hypothetical protein
LAIFIVMLVEDVVPLWNDAGIVARKNLKGV